MKHRTGHFSVVFVVLLWVLPAISNARPELYPLSTNCGYKIPGEPANHFSVSIRNSSLDILSFTGEGIALEGDDAGEFELSDMSHNPHMAPGEILHVKIRWSPQTLGAKEARLVVTTNDPSNPEKSVPLSGNCVAARNTVASGLFDGYGPGVSTVGSGGDYPSLHSAAEAISANPLTGGDWTFRILNDLTEPNNSIIGQRNTNGHTITIRPADGTAPVITFTTTTENLSGWSGHLLIGAEASFDTGNYQLKAHPIANITIDGSSLPGGNDRSLAFRNINPNNFGSTALLQVKGNCDNIHIRNCRFVSAGSTYDEDGVGFPAVVDFAAVNNFPHHPAAPPDDVPDSASIVNCEIKTTGSASLTGIGFNNRRTSNPPYHIDPGSRDVIISGNTISTHVAMVVRSCANALISSNTINLDIFEPDFRSPIARGGIYYGLTLPEGGATESRIVANEITCHNDGPTTKSFDCIAVETRQTTNTVLVANNMISGITGPPKGGSNFALLYGIRNASDQLCTVTIAHNSISFDHREDAQATAPRCAAIANATINQYFSGNTVIKNNIIRMATAGGAALMRLPGPSSERRGYLISDNNVIYTGTDCFTAYVHDQASRNFYPTLEEWQQASDQDLMSRNLDPFVPTSPGMGTWRSPQPSNLGLRFSSFPGEEYFVPAHTDVTDDIDGDVRSGALSIAGADEIENIPAAVGDWVLY